MKYITTSEAPQPGGHYSQGICYNGLLFISGQLAINPKTGEKMLGSIEEQTQQVLDNMESIAHAAGSDRNHVLKITIYLSDINLWNKVNQVYASFFDKHRPARAIVPCQTLHHGFLIELEAVVAVED
jgi:2-iminobutanoate/2-iminopropanoate deaminase